jgi:HSP20 family protein
MANITVRRTSGGDVPAPVGREWEPMRMMRELLGWDPFREMAPAWPLVTREEFSPAFDIKETKEGYLFKADMPGIDEKDLEVTLTGNRLSISGKREAEKAERTDTYYRCERSYGSFLRSFTLPEGVDVDHVRSELKNGELTMVVPKKPGMQPKKIEVQTGEKAKS